MNLQLSDVAIDNRASPSHIQIILKQSKGDQFTKGAQIRLGRTTHAVCSVQAPVQCPGPLFLFSNSIWLTRGLFRTALNKALVEP